MTWTDHLLNSERIKAIYGSEVPSLNSACIHEIRLDRRATSAYISMDLLDYPSPPPAKWTSNNTIQVELYISDIESLSVDGWASEMHPDLEIHKTHGSKIRITSTTTPRLEIIAEWISISKISSYHNSSRPQ